MNLDKSLVVQIDSICRGRVERFVSLSNFSRWKIGGVADIIAHPNSVEQLMQLRKLLSAADIPSVTVGSTSNLLFSDAGVRVPIIVLDEGFDEISVEGNRVEAGAAIWVPLLARKVQQLGLSGIEHTCGIPGTLGGLVCMNGGSQRRGIGENLTLCVSVDSEGNRIERSKSECLFEYRNSIFQKKNDIIVSACIELEFIKNKGDIRKEMISILSARRKKFPKSTPNCGSVFKSNPAMYPVFGPPGQIIEKLGFKGLISGRAQVSPQHANFITNLGGATAKDVLEIVSLIRKAVHDSTSHVLEVEAQYVSSFGEIISGSSASDLYMDKALPL